MMPRIFRHADGRILAAEQAGGIGGGATHEAHRLATEDEIAAFLAKEAEVAIPAIVAAAADVL